MLILCYCSLTVLIIRLQNISTVVIFLKQLAAESFYNENKTKDSYWKKKEVFGKQLFINSHSRISDDLERWHGQFINHCIFTCTFTWKVLKVHCYFLVYNSYVVVKFSFSSTHSASNNGFSIVLLDDISIKIHHKDSINWHIRCSEDSLRLILIISLIVL